MADREQNVTVVFHGEDHTLGNSLRYVLAREFVHLHSSFLCSKDVDFAGYTVPHPAEAKMNIRIQTKSK